MCPVGRFCSPACVNGKGCNPGLSARPVYMHGYCWPCWASLSPLKRWSLQEDAALERDSETGDTIAFDPVGIYDEIEALPVFKGERRFAA